MSKPFLTAAWKDLIVCNYAIDAALLRQYIPLHTELDLYNNQAFVSIVAFRFLNTRVLGIPIPFHRNFNEINLRFYTRYRSADGWRRGVTFIKELVPKRAVALVAKTLYNENYYAVPMQSLVRESEGRRELAYSWTEANRIHTVQASTFGAATDLIEGSLTEFIIEHYWGYTKQRNGSTMEYEVKHPRWKIWDDCSVNIDCDFEKVYGEHFAKVFEQTPTSSFVADGSEIAVHKGEILRAV